VKAVLDEARDIIFEAIMVRRGEVITPELAIERARNAAQALMVLLCPPDNRPETTTPVDWNDPRIR
jgi:hypothetical protein